MLCSAGFPSSHMWWVWWNHVQRRDRGRQKSDLHGLGDETKSSLRNVYWDGGAAPPRLWARHLWICIKKPITGPTSSSRWTENLKPTVSWAAGRREGRKHMKMWGDKEHRIESERENKTHLWNKAMSSSNFAVVKSMEIASFHCCSILPDQARVCVCVWDTTQLKATLWVCVSLQLKSSVSQVNSKHVEDRLHHSIVCVFVCACSCARMCDTQVPQDDSLRAHMIQRRKWQHADFTRRTSRGEGWRCLTTKTGHLYGSH